MHRSDLSLCLSVLFRKLLREDQLEPVTKAAQQEELERRKRLEQQRKDYAAPIPTVPFEFLPGEQWRRERPESPGVSDRAGIRSPSHGNPLESFHFLGALEQRGLIHRVPMAEHVLLKLILFKCLPPPLLNSGS